MLDHHKDQGLEFILTWCHLISPRHKSPVPHTRYIGRTRTGCYPCRLRSGFNLIPVRLTLTVGSLYLVFDLLVSFINWKICNSQALELFYFAFLALSRFSDKKICHNFNTYRWLLLFFYRFWKHIHKHFYPSRNLSTSKTYYICKFYWYPLIDML